MSHSITNKREGKWAKHLNKHLTKEDTQTASRHEKRCFTSSFVREMQMKTMEYHYIPMMSDQHTQHDNNKCWQGHNKSNTHSGGKAKWYRHFGRQLGSLFFMHLDILIPCNVMITLWYLPKEAENLCPYKNHPVDVSGSFIHTC